MARKSLQRWVLGDEAQVAVVSGVERTERYILQGVEIINTRAASGPLQKVKVSNNVIIN